jgi:hypothetical protein
VGSGRITHGRFVAGTGQVLLNFEERALFVKRKDYKLTVLSRILQGKPTERFSAEYDQIAGR